MGLNTLFIITQSRALKTLQPPVQVSLYKMMQTQVNTKLFSYCILQQMLAIYTIQITLKRNHEIIPIK